MATGGSGLGAGPLTTEPSLTLNLLPWHGQSMVPLAIVATMQPWCVQTALNPLNVPATGCVSTTFGPSMILPPPTGTSAVVASWLAGAALPAPAPEDAPPPAAAWLLGAADDGGGPAIPPLLAS